MILISGAAGKTGLAIIRALAARGAEIRAFVRSEDHRTEVTGAGAAEVVVGDMRHPDAYLKAVRGVQALYHICPNVSPHEVAIAEVAMRSAQAAGVSHFVYHSVLRPQIEAMPHHWLKMRVEERLFASGLNVTIVQPAAYMQNVLGVWKGIIGEAAYRAPYPRETRLGMVDLNDVAEAVALILTTPGHKGAVYELSGPQALTQADVVGILGEVLGGPVRFEQIPLDDWEANARHSGLGDYQIDTLLAMFRYYADFGFWGNPNILRWLLNREPVDFRTFVHRVMNPTPE